MSPLKLLSNPPCPLSPHQPRASPLTVSHMGVLAALQTHHPAWSLGSCNFLYLEHSTPSSAGFKDTPQRGLPSPAPKKQARLGSHSPH